MRSMRPPTNARAVLQTHRVTRTHSHRRRRRRIGDGRSTATERQVVWGHGLRLDNRRIIAASINRRRPLTKPGEHGQHRTGVCQP